MLTSSTPQAESSQSILGKKSARDASISRKSNPAYVERWQVRRLGSNVKHVRIVASWNAHKPGAHISGAVRRSGSRFPRSKLPKAEAAPSQVDEHVTSPGKAFQQLAILPKNRHFPCMLERSSKLRQDKRRKTSLDPLQKIPHDQLLASHPGAAPAASFACNAHVSCRKHLARTLLLRASHAACALVAHRNQMTAANLSC